MSVVALEKYYDKYHSISSLANVLENETVNGVQFSESHNDKSPESFPFHLPPTDKLLPLVAEYSSSFMSKPIPLIPNFVL